jgi:hypothetical protein
MKHTPGPWLYQEKSDAYTHIVRGPSGQYVAGCGQCSHGECEANARLIAAAPEMLQTLESIATTLDKFAPCPEEILDNLLAAAQSAIKTARPA